MHNNTFSLLTPAQAKKEIPFPHKSWDSFSDTHTTCRNIIEKKDDRIALFVGPCSIHEEDGAYAFAMKLKKLQEQIKDHFLLIMRLFVEKSRSKYGWRGFLYDPFLDNSHEIEQGIIRVRKLFSHMIEAKIPICCELLDPLAVSYYADLISWGFIGARTSSSSPHRRMASSFSFPIGFKNSVHGEVDVALHAAMVARKEGVRLGISEEGNLCKVQSPGNTSSHVVLRGSSRKANFYPKDIEKTILLQMQEKLPNGIVVDCAHGNSKKLAHLQKIGFSSVVDQIAHHNKWIKGIMFESYLNEGSQPVAPLRELKYGVSITDPCLRWEESEQMILQACDRLSSVR